MENLSSPAEDSVTSSYMSNHLHCEEGLVINDFTRSLTGPSPAVYRSSETTSFPTPPFALSPFAFASFFLSQSRVLLQVPPFHLSTAPDLQEGSSKMSDFPGDPQRPVFGKASFSVPQQYPPPEPRGGPQPSLAMELSSTGRIMETSSDDPMLDVAAHPSSLASPAFGVYGSVGRPLALSQPPSTGERSLHAPPALGFSQWANNSGFAPVPEPDALPGIGVRSMSIPPRPPGSASLASIAGREQQLIPYIKREEGEDSKGVLSQLIPRSPFEVALPVRGSETSAPRPFESWPGVGEQIVGACPRLGALDPNNLTASQVLFYFGVLTTQQPLHPQFTFSRDDTSGRWGVKLTLYGQTLTKPNLYGSKSSVKVEVCREALGHLKDDYAQWIVPDEPNECLTAPEWKWAELLEDHCKQELIPLPKYTRYTHENGYRYEAELPGTSAFGVRKFYRTEKDAIEAAAHRGLYLLLVNDLNDANTFPGSSMLTQNGEKLLSLVPRALPSQPTYGNQSGNMNDFPILHQSQSKSSRARKSRGSKKKKNGPPANLIPLQRSRIMPIEVKNQSQQQSRWSVSPKSLRREIRSENTYSAQLQKTCKLLELGYPSIDITRTNGSVNGQYCVKASFPHDPFLSRASADGVFEAVHGDMNAAKETCCRKVVEYLIQLVEEDATIEREAREQREKVLNWPGAAMAGYVQRTLHESRSNSAQ
ncbi:hypothetical protein VTN77DRAFT_8551 [Rasamsonia byssochlamydoides]|uniref:uncharacterized protein n=1 Tax=Rasamsonia byssochlamydoides TaxID=89139 RepID=UPI003744555B